MQAIFICYCHSQIPIFKYHLTEILQAILGAVQDWNILKLTLNPVWDLKELVTDSGFV